jgi:predicted CoA-binding protein
MIPNPSDPAIHALLGASRTIALVGASANQSRPVQGVMRYLLAAGFDVFPINPGLAGGTLLGRPVFARVADVPIAIDIVDIFRRTAALAGVVDEVLHLRPLPKVIWMQLGLRDDTAAERALNAGVMVVMDRCIKIEHTRLM